MVFLSNSQFFLNIGVIFTPTSNGILSTDIIYPKHLAHVSMQYVLLFFLILIIKSDLTILSVYELSLSPKL